MIHSGYYPLFYHYIINLTLTAYRVWLIICLAGFTNFYFHIIISSCVNFGQSRADIAWESSVYRKTLQLTINTNFLPYFNFEFNFLD